MQHQQRPPHTRTHLLAAVVGGQVLEGLGLAVDVAAVDADVRRKLLQVVWRVRGTNGVCSAWAAHVPQRPLHRPNMSGTPHTPGDAALPALTRCLAVSLRPKRGGAGLLVRRFTLIFSLAPLTYTRHTGDGARVMAVCCAHSHSGERGNTVFGTGCGQLSTVNYLSA